MLEEIYRKLDNFLKKNPDVDFFKVVGDDIDNETSEEMELSASELWVLRGAIK